MYNFFYDPDYKSPYGDRLNVRMGFEYSIAKRTEKKVKKSKTKKSKEAREIKTLEEGEVPNPEYRRKEKF